MNISKWRQAQKCFLCSMVITSAFFFAAHAHASVIINEIMYDAEGADIDWVELYNDASSAQDITGWKFGDASSANHAINVPPANGGQGSMNIPAGGYVILAGDANAFLSAHSGFSDVVLDTTMSLTNTSGTISIRETSNGAAVDSVTYNSDQGASGDGNSLQLVDGDWTVGTPTPDAENASSTSNDDDTDTTTIADTSDAVSTKNEIVAPRFTADILAPKIMTSTTPTPFEALVRTQDKGEVKSGTYIWNMGDGTTYEKKGNEEFTHTYMYPGEYVVHLEFFDKSRNVPLYPDDTDELVVHVVSSNLLISTTSDGGIVITNKNSRDVALDGFQIRVGASSFVFPKHSIVLAGKSVTLSPARLGLSVGASVALVTAAGIVESEYPNKSARTTAKESSRVLSYQEMSTASVQDAFTEGSEDVSIAKEKTLVQERTNTKPIIVWIAIIAVIGIGILMYIFLGRPTQTEEGFSLLDE